MLIFVLYVLVISRTVYMLFVIVQCALMRNICLNWARAHEPSFQYSFGIPLFRPSASRE